MQVGDLIKNGNTVGVIVKIHDGLADFSDLYEIRWLKTNTTTNLTKAIMDLMGMEILNEDR